MEQVLSPREVYDILMQKDAFSRWLGLVPDEIAPGSCKLHFRVTENMLNGFEIIHGGVVFAAADSAFAFACNTYGMLSVALDAHISFIASAKLHDVLYVEAKEKHRGRKTGFYDIRVTQQDGSLVASFQGTAYQTSKTIRSLKM